MAAGDGLCDERAVSVLVEDGPRYVRELMDWGAAFDRGPDGQPELALEAAHSARRVLHAQRRDRPRDRPGAVGARRRRLRNVRIQAHARVVSLIVEDEQCVGVEFLQDDGTRAIGARARHAAGDRRRRAGVQRDDESARRDRRRGRDGVPRGRRRSPIWSSSSFIRRR